MTKSGQGRGVGREVAKHHDGDPAQAAPRGETEGEGVSALGEEPEHRHHGERARHRSDDPPASLLQGCAEVRLAHDGRCRRRPEGILEFERIGDVERQTNRRRKPDAEQGARTPGTKTRAQGSGICLRGAVESALYSGAH